MDEMINNPHDRFFKEIFSKRENIEDLLRNALPEELVEKLDFDSLEYSGNSYIDDELKDLQSDLVVRMKVGDEECLFYILFEHKSYRDRLSLFQLLKYMVKIWDSEVKSHPKSKRQKANLTPVIPILFNQSGYRWTHGDRFSIYFDNPNNLLKGYIPSFSYLIYDLKGLSDEDLAGNVWFISAIRLMKHIRKLEPILDEILDYINSHKDILEDYPIVIATFILYLFSGSHESEGDYIEHTLEKKEKEGVYMSLAKKIKEEGIKEGIKEGIQKGREEGIQKGREEGLKQKAMETAKRLKTMGVDIEKIAEATGLSKKQIEKL